MSFWDFVFKLLLLKWLFGSSDEESETSCSYSPEDDYDTDNDSLFSGTNTFHGPPPYNGWETGDDDWGSDSSNFFHDEQDDYDITDDY
ncbi:MAG: hypothetical protein K2M79_00730 [Muribaculaceae bacterium]|nr:hypothetical protein [Muribaculaceae bacterium]